RWGILAADGTVPPWSRGLVEGTAIDTDALRDALPAEIDRIYLQADLTAVAPGPLAPRLDLRLRRIARRESRAQASTYRFTAESIGAGLTDGESAHSIRAFLRKLSLTGIPQPLDYVIETTASRHGSITVRSDAASPNTIVESSDAHLLDLVVIDQALRPVGLVRHGDVLVSRVGRDHLFWALADARYPVVALDEHGAPESLRRRTAAQSASAEPAGDVYARLIGSLRASGGDGDAAWLERELEQAVRTKSIIVVTAQISAAETRTFTLEATGLGGGRLRGRDRGADVERTLPISTIVNVAPA
ncbi:MAG: helicase-associated domain-containing protein, partial [Micrococcales bacterium]|nr:helicase-associated domain-containing protein [Micrococcales bacterium]